MEILVHPLETSRGCLIWPGGRADCVLGRGGVRPDKHEGDGATPVGRFALRRVLWRADRLAPPVTRLPIDAIRPDDGWCDDPADPAYNRPVRLPYPAGHEILWREDGVYDLILVIGHNDDPPAPGAGSAVFVHLTRPDGAPTAGCVALAAADLLALLKDCAPGDGLTVYPAAPSPVGPAE